MTTNNGNILPHGENLRRAIAWLSEERGHSLAKIEEASLRFDLTPQEEDFLLRHFKVGAGGDAESSK